MPAANPGLQPPPLTNHRMDNPTRNQFAQLMMDAIRKAGETGEIAYERDEFRVPGRGRERDRHLPGERLPGVLLGTGGATGEDPQAVRAQLVRPPAGDARGIRGRQARPLPGGAGPLLLRPDPAPDGGREEGRPWPHEVLGKHLAVGLVYDFPDSMWSIPQGALDAWGVSFYEALEVARRNLTELSTPSSAPSRARASTSRRRRTARTPPASS